MQAMPNRRLTLRWISLAIPILLALAATGPASAAPGGGQQQKSRFWTEVYCVDPGTQLMHYVVHWSTFQPTPGVPLEITVTFRRPDVELQFTVPADVLGTSQLAREELAPGAYASWADVETVDARATGAFGAVNRGAVRQPAGGWSPNCPG